MTDAVEQLAQRTQVFYKYIKVVLPLDGFVFWVRADQLTPSALYNSFKYNAVPYNQAQAIQQAANKLVVKGSIHYAITLGQEEEETYSTNAFTFTAEDQVNDLNAVGPTMMYVTTYKGIRFAFSSTDNFFEQAGLWHYHGNAVYADMATQIIDNIGQLMTRQVVSNSVPIWLSFNFFQPAAWEPFSPPAPFFPSFLLPLNQKPPFCSVHVVPESTVSLQSSPFYDTTWGRSELNKETVRVTTYGLGNGQISDLIDFVLMWASNNPTIMGVMNIPVARDEKRAQVEFQAIAQRKSVEFEVNYYQSAARNITRQLIKQIFVTHYVGDTPIPFTDMAALFQ